MSSIFGKINSETPKYELLADYKDFEIRRYQPCIKAEVEYHGALTDSSGGFRDLAGYIFGGNVKSEKIAMTSPVLTHSLSNGNGGGEGTVKMAFIMPSKYQTLSELPVPNNSRVGLIECPTSTFAVIKFNGSATDQEVNEKYRKLKEELLPREGIKLAPSNSAIPILARYNPPWTIPSYRINEVMIQVDWCQEKEP